MAARTLIDRYRDMVKMRRFDEAVLEALTAGEIAGEMHLAIGQEAIAAGMVGTLRESDALVSTHRAHYHAIAKGVQLRPLAAELFHRETGLCRGRGGHMHQHKRFLMMKADECMAVPDAPLPAAPIFEREILPTRDRILQAIHRMVHEG
ncbi:MAG: thiamine pyrophosphate-dependent enzyme [Actinomycetota bacterium]